MYENTPTVDWIDFERYKNTPTINLIDGLIGLNRIKRENSNEILLSNKKIESSEFVKKLLEKELFLTNTEIEARTIQISTIFKFAYELKWNIQYSSIVNKINDFCKLSTGVGRIVDLNRSQAYIVMEGLYDMKSKEIIN